MQSVVGRDSQTSEQSQFTVQKKTDFILQKHAATHHIWVKQWQEELAWGLVITSNNSGWIHV